MKILKQYNVPWLGAVVDSLYTSLPILSIINFLSITTVLYATVQEYLISWAPWFTIWWFLGFLTAATTFTMVGVYLFVLPSIWTFRNRQMNSFDSEVLKELQALRKEIYKLRGENVERTIKQ